MTLEETVQDYKQRFIEFMVQSGVLTFGDFTTKAGRKTPYFVNTGRYRTGLQMTTLAGFYADAIEASGVEYDFLFGPAYKGIPLCVATSMALGQRGHDTAFCFNRKEAKDHGEGGTLVGHAPQSGERALIIEDVTTAGTSIRETVPLLRACAPITLGGLVVSVDRMERGTGSQTALKELSTHYGMPCFSIVNVHEIMAHLLERPILGNVVLTAARHEQMLEYLRLHGADA